MVIIVFAQVFCRFVLKGALPWSEEASRYIMIWLSMLGASIGLRHGAHVGVEALVNVLSPKLRRAVHMLTCLISLGFSGAVVCYGYRLLHVVKRQVSPAMEISMVIPYSALVVGGLLMGLYSIEAAFRKEETSSGGSEVTAE
ncbi:MULTISPECIES: TRAP transporter small permease [Jonquetella]|uniref:TRAP transporter small permease n=1 Tax=Jonquetella TaxID=428711 RepID=UPI0012DF6AB5|nr:MULTISPECIES: TRAP transporter small permease [Jonquetella]